MNIQRALAFLDASGETAFTALGRCAVGLVDAEAVLTAIAPYQRADGSWAGIDKDMPAQISSISQTWIGLQWLIWLRPAGGDLLDKTVAFLRAAQKPNGCWDEPDEIKAYNPPPWMLPGDPANQRWLTSAGACKLKELGRTGDVNFAAALDFIRSSWDAQARRFTEYPHTHWMVLPLLFDSPDAHDRDIAAGCRDLLSGLVDRSALDPYDYHSVAYAALLTGDDDLFKRALAKIESFQQADGGMSTNYGDQHRPNGTVETLFLLRDANLLSAAAAPESAPAPPAPGG